MIWGCFVGDRLGPLVFCEGNVNSDGYIKILNENLKDFKESLEDEWEVPLILQEDNAAIHTSKTSKKWKEENGFTCLAWPPQSPDLNPIENLSKILKDNIRRKMNFPKSVNELKVALAKEWSRLDPQLLFRLIESMPRRYKW